MIEGDIRLNSSFWWSCVAERIQRHVLQTYRQTHSFPTICNLLHWPHVSGCILCWPFGQYSPVILLWLMFMIICWLINSLN